MKNIDLHVHSTASDGSYKPSELVDYAIRKNLSAIALTDHDTCDGLDEAINYAASINSDIKIIPGIELSAEYMGEDVHILGLNIDYKNKQFLSELKEFQDSRSNRNKKMISKLQENGFNITQEMVDNRFKDAVITRAHYAILLIESGYVNSKDEAFEKWLDKGCPCYIPRHKITTCDAVRLIKKAGGHPVMAHPVLYHFSDEVLYNLIEQLKNEGLEGLEAIYCLNTPEDEIKYKVLAEKFGLYITGGSDFHGIAKPNLELGTGYNNNICIPEYLLKNII